MVRTGIDNTVSCYGELVKYKKLPDGAANIQHLQVIICCSVLQMPSRGMMRHGFHRAPFRCGLTCPRRAGLAHVRVPPDEHARLA